jgi:hypothetical protein
MASVMAGFIPAIHVLAKIQDVDARDKPGHDAIVDDSGEA